MVLVVDIGNTNIVLGVYNNDELVGSWRMLTKNDKTADEYGMYILSLLQYNNIDYKKISSAIISSVVPNVMHSFTNTMKRYFNIDPLIVGPGIKTGIMIKSENPKEVGSDRIVDSVAAYEQYGGPLIVIDFGTATTYDVISEQGEFLYGITSPGIQICADALWSKTAQLPNIEIKKPNTILAKNTITSMQAGLVTDTLDKLNILLKK